MTTPYRSEDQEEKFQEQITALIELAYQAGMPEIDAAAMLLGIAVSRCIASGATRIDLHMLVDALFTEYHSS